MWRLFTPTQMKKNEDFMWRLADEKIDEFIDDGKVEFGRVSTHLRTPAW